MYLYFSGDTYRRSRKKENFVYINSVTLYLTRDSSKNIKPIDFNRIKRLFRPMVSNVTQGNYVYI